MKTKSKIIGIVCLVVMMLLCICGFNIVEQALAETTEQTAENEFDILNGTIINYKGDSTGTVEIPSSINGETVQGLAMNSFRSKLLTGVVIPETVTTISTRAFFDCRMLETVTWGNSGSGAGLSIAAGAFTKCTSLESLTIPSRTTSLSDAAFNGCSSLSDIYVEEGNTTYRNGTNGYEGVVFLQTSPDTQSKDAAYIWPTAKIPYQVHHIIGMAGYEVETVVGPVGYTYTLPQAVGPYEVVGWYTEADYTSEELGETYTIAESEQTVYTLYALLTDETGGLAYISFDAQGGVLADTAINPCLAEEDTDYTAYIPERKGYEFAGWYSLPAGQGEKIIDEQGTLLQQEALESQILYARWTAQRYTIKFNEYDGTLVTTVAVDYGSAIEVVIRERVGYTFLGWYTEQEIAEMTVRLTDEEGAFLAETWEDVYDWSDGNTINVYALYNANKYNVTFECTQCGKQVEQEVYYDASVGLSPICQHNGYVLNGWSETESGTVKYTGEAFEWDYTTDKALYTVWETEVYTITYKDGNTVIANSGNPTSYTVEDSITFEEYAPTGYNFVSWLDESGDEITGITEGSTGNRIINLEKEGKLVQIKFDYRGAYSEETNQVTYGNEFTLPNKTLGDYPEVKWKDTMSGEIYLVNTDITVTFLEDRTYQAVWTAPVTLHYLEGDIGTVALTYGEEFELPVVEETGWIFQGWAEASGGYDFVTDANGVSLAPFDMTEDFHLYAIYEGEEKIVTLDKQGGIDGTSQIRVKVGEALPMVDINGAALEEPSKTGQTFVGYYTESDAGKGEKIYNDEMASAVSVWSASYPTTLYAHWDDTKYTVTLYTEDEGGDRVIFDTITAFYGVKLPDLDHQPDLKGHTFAGFVDEEDRTYYNADAESYIWDKESNGELYAKFDPNEYQITLISNNGKYDVKTHVTAVYGEPMPYPGLSREAPVKAGYKFVGYYTKEDKGGVQYYGMEVINEEEYSYSMGLEWGGYYEGLKSTRNWDIAENTTLYAYFEPLECFYEYSNIWLNNGYLTPSQVYIVSMAETIVEAKEIDGYKFLYFNKNFEEITTKKNTWKIELKRYRSDGIIRPKDEFFAVYEKIVEEDTCLAKGTMITLADGTQKAVELLTGNEMLLVWNLLTGEFDIAPMVFIDSDPAALYKVINLYFSDGTRVKVISEHAFWDVNLNQYVYLREDADQYIGHWFKKQGTNGLETVQLVNVVVQEEYTSAWSPVTYGHLCYFVDGMLSIPGGIEGLFNIFEVDSETMMYDMEQMQADIAQYGLYTYEEFTAIFPVPEEIFDAFNAQYFKVAIGKGMLTLERVGQLIERYSEFF